MKIHHVRIAMKLWQREARKFGQASPEAKRAFLAYREFSNKFTEATHVRLTSYLLGDIDIPPEPEWVAEANKKVRS